MSIARSRGPVRRRQPQHPTGLSRADGFYFASIAGDKYLAGGKLPGMSAGKLANPHGLAGELPLLGGQISGPITTVSAGSWSILIDFKPVSKGNVYPYFIGISGATNSFALAWAHDSFGNRAIWYDGVAGRDSGLTFPLGEMHVLGISYDDTTKIYSFFRDGVAGNTVAGANTGLGNWQFAAAGGEANTTHINLLALSDKALSAARMRELTANPSQLFKVKPRDSWFASTGPTLIELTTASFGWAKNPIQNRATATMSTPTLKANAQSIQNRWTIATTVASLKFSAQSIQNRMAATLTTAALKFVAHPITVGALATLIQLTTAAFNYSAKALQFSQRVALSTAAWAFTPKPIQNRRTVTMTAATLSFLAKALQSKLTIALTVASFSFIAWAINVTGAVASVVARLLTLLGVGS